MNINSPGREAPLYTFQRKTKALTTFVCFKRSSNKQEDPFSKIAVSGRRVIFAEKIFGGARIRKLSRSFQKCDHCGIAVRSDCQISSTSRVRIPLKCKNDPKSRFESTDRIIATPTRQFFFGRNQRPSAGRRWPSRPNKVHRRFCRRRGRRGRLSRPSSFVTFHKTRPGSGI